MEENLKKVLFIDRDGTILVEPEDEQVDSLEKMEWVPGGVWWTVSAQEQIMIRSTVHSPSTAMKQTTL